jgi:bacteriocin-like protein
MSEHEDPKMEIETLSDDDLESVSGGLKAETSGTGTCNTGAGVCTTHVGGTCNTTGGGTCNNVP